MRKGLRRVLKSPLKRPDVDWVDALKGARNPSTIYFNIPLAPPAGHRSHPLHVTTRSPKYSSNRLRRHARDSTYARVSRVPCPHSKSDGVQRIRHSAGPPSLP